MKGSLVLLLLVVVLAAFKVTTSMVYMHCMGEGWQQSVYGHASIKATWIKKSFFSIIFDFLRISHKKTMPKQLQFYISIYKFYLKLGLKN